MVDEADAFPVVLQRVVDWLQERELGTKYKYAILTDGLVFSFRFVPNIKYVSVSTVFYCFKPHFMNVSSGPGI